MNGAFWGFNSYKEAAKYAEALKGDKSITIRTLHGGEHVVLEINPDYLLKAVSAAAPDLLTQQDVANMKKGVVEGQAQLEKFLIRNADKNFANMVGIYCVNDTTSITYKGTAYPSFRIPATTALNALANWGYQIRVGDRFMTPQQAAQAGSALFKSMVMSPTNTGVFIQIKSTLTPEQLKNLKIQRGMAKPTK